MSLWKQATQTPMFPGLPHFCKRGAKTPIKTPTLIIPFFVAKNFLRENMEYIPHCNRLNICWINQKLMIITLLRNLQIFNIYGNASTYMIYL